MYERRSADEGVGLRTGGDEVGEALAVAAFSLRFLLATGRAPELRPHIPNPGESR